MLDGCDPKLMIVFSRELRSKRWMQQKYLVLRDFLISINLPDGLSREPGARIVY
jgi:hypothetical protein